MEDNPTDAQLVQAMLGSAGFNCDIRRIDTREGFEAALQGESWDLVISDFTLPSFDGLSALILARKTRPELPFIFVSGTIGEEAAVESLRCGATDYILKDRMSRLPASVQRAVQESRTRAEQRRAAEKIREQAALLDNARDAICVTDMDHRVIYWNKGAERLIGWSAQEVAGRNVAEMLFRPDDKRPLEALKQLIRTGEWQGELDRIGKDRQNIIVESRWTLLRDEVGQARSILMIDTDITEKKRIEGELLRSQRMQSIGALAGGIAHDLNNVLAPILLVAELLREELRSEESREMLDTAKASAQRGADMVKQILAFARGVSGDLKVLQVKHLVNEMTKLVRDTFPRSIRVQSRIAGQLHRIQGDATQLHQVLLNLCVNARDAMPRGGTLRIEAGNATLENRPTSMRPGPVSGEFVVLTVGDTGCGIPEELRDQIYEPFFTTKEPGKGTGLGLSSVRAIVQAHQGFLEVESQVDAGTVFRVYLPAATTPDTGFVRLGLPAVQMGRGETVLLVDDEAALLAITRETLQAFNYRVFTAENGAEALALFRPQAGEIQAVITDMMMPVMDGATLVRELRRIRPQVKVICVTGLASRSPPPEIEQLQPHAFLAKPYSTEKLLNTLRGVITAP